MLHNEETLTRDYIVESSWGAFRNSKIFADKSCLFADVGIQNEIY